MNVFRGLIVLALIVFGYAHAATIAATGSPCAVPAGGNQCSVTVTWTSTVAVNVYVQNPATGAENLFASASGSGSQIAPWISFWPGANFVLRNASTHAQLAIVSNVFGRSAAPARVTGGSNYTWYQVDMGPGNCPIAGTTTCGNFWPYDIVRNYNLPGIRSTVQSKLASIYASGQRRLRHLVYHCRGCGGAGNSEEDSTYVAGWYLPAQFRTNFANFVADVKAAGFANFYLSMAPQGYNNVPGYCSSMTPATITSYQNENFGVISELRTLLVSSGMPYTIDLSNEMMPVTGISAPCVFSYASSLWSSYVTTFGNADTSGFSTITLDVWDVNNRLANAATVYGSTTPQYIDLHIYKYTAETAQTVLRAAATMIYQMWPTTAATKHIVIGETDYELVDSTYADSLAAGARDVGSVEALYQ